MTLGERLRKEREKRGWSQLYVAQKLGITNTVLSNYERNYREPDNETLTKIADLYEVSVDYLLGRTDNPSPPDSNKDEFDDPEIGLWFKDLKNASPEELRRLKQIWELINEKEKDRKPGQKQGE